MRVRRLAIGCAALAGCAAGAYAAYVVTAWRRYGRAALGDGSERDELLDRFMPSYDVVERHHIRIAAPSDVVFDTACDLDVFQTPIARTLFRAREVLLQAAHEEPPPARGVLAAAEAIGWRVLARVPGREVVVGAVTRPWEANVTFRGIAPEQFVTFAEPAYVKIAWTLRAEPIGDGASMFRTETRAIATDAEARTRFRRYWAFLSPGIVLIRLAALRPLKTAAERGR